METALAKVPGRSDETTRTYLCRLRRARSITGAKSSASMLKAHGASLAALDAHYAHPETYKLALSAVAALVSANPKWERNNPGPSAAWRDALKAARTAPRRTTDLAAVRHKFVCFETVVAARKRLAAAGPNRGDLSRSLTHLLLVFFTQVPPKRADYNALRVVAARGGPLPDEGNYVVVDGPREARLVMHDFKTARASAPPFEERLVPEAAAALCASLAAHPRGHVFVGRDGGAMTPGAFSQFVIRRTQRPLGKPVGVTQLRHAYVTALYEGGAPRADKARAAESMQHSVATQKTYVVTRPNGAPVCAAGPPPAITKRPLASRKARPTPRPSR